MGGSTNQVQSALNQIKHRRLLPTTSRYLRPRGITTPDSTIAQASVQPSSPPGRAKREEEEPTVRGSRRLKTNPDTKGRRQVESTKRSRIWSLVEIAVFSIVEERITVEELTRARAGPSANPEPKEPFTAICDTTRSRRVGWYLDGLFAIFPFSPGPPSQDLRIRYGLQPRPRWRSIAVRCVALPHWIVSLPESKKGIRYLRNSFLRRSFHHPSIHLSTPTFTRSTTETNSLQRLDIPFPPSLGLPCSGSLAWPVRRFESKSCTYRPSGTVVSRWLYPDSFPLPPILGPSPPHPACPPPSTPSPLNSPLQLLSRIVNPYCTTSHSATQSRTKPPVFLRSVSLDRYLRLQRPIVGIFSSEPPLFEHIVPPSRVVRLSSRSPRQVTYLPLRLYPSSHSRRSINGERQLTFWVRQGALATGRGRARLIRQGPSWQNPSKSRDRSLRCFSISSALHGPIQLCSTCAYDCHRIIDRSKCTSCSSIRQASGSREGLGHANLAMAPIYSATFAILVPIPKLFLCSCGSVFLVCFSFAGKWLILATHT